MKTLFEEDLLVCYFDDENKIVYHIWKDKAKGESFRNGLLRVFKNYTTLKKDYPHLHWLGDTQKMSVLPLEDQKWLDETWNELLFEEAGVKTHAVIVGNDAFARYAMEKFKNTMTARYSDKQILLETFKTESEAIEWFKALNEKEKIST